MQLVWVLPPGQRCVLLCACLTCPPPLLPCCAPASPAPLPSCLPACRAIAGATATSLTLRAASGWATWRRPASQVGWAAYHQAGWGLRGMDDAGVMPGAWVVCTTPETFRRLLNSHLARPACLPCAAPVRACGLSEDCRHLLAVLGKGFIFRWAGCFSPHLWLCVAVGAACAEERWARAPASGGRLLGWTR